MPLVSVERTGPTVVTLRCDDLQPGESQWFLLRADAHHDNLGCDQKLEKKHLDQAVERGAMILDFGDLVDGMDGREDKRADKTHLPAAIRQSDKPYLSALLDYLGEFYEPYAKNWALLGLGNHETKLAQVKEINLTEHLARRLKEKGSPVEVGGYQGWVRFMFRWNKTKQQSYRLWYHHGFGGGGSVSKGVPQAHRQMAYLGNADFIVNGHVHTSYWVTDVKHSLDKNGVPECRNVECLRAPGYKREFDRGDGWAVEKGHPPRPLGAWWLRFFVEDQEIHYEVLQAK